MMRVGWRWKERKRVGFLFGGDGLGREREEEDLEGVIPQGPSGNSIGFWFPSQRKLNFAKSEKLFCKNIVCFLLSLYLESERQEKEAECLSLPDYALLSGSRITHCADVIQKKDSVQSCSDFIWMQSFNKRFVCYFFHLFPKSLLHCL